MFESKIEWLDKQLNYQLFKLKKKAVITGIVTQSDIKPPSKKAKFNLLSKIKELIVWTENLTAKSVSRKPIQSDMSLDVTKGIWQLTY